MTRRSDINKPLTRQSGQYIKASNAWKRRLKRTGYIQCHLCGNEIPLDATFPSPLALEVDHLTPLSKNGSLMDESNWAPSHASCNRTKANKLEFKIEKVRSSRKW